MLALTAVLVNTGPEEPGIGSKERLYHLAAILVMETVVHHLVELVVEVHVALDAGRTCVLQNNIFPGTQPLIERGGV